MRIAGEKRIKGERGEDAACAYLRKERYTILWRNYNTDHGEIDIVAEDRHNIVFAEVKTRADRKETLDRFGPPSRAVNRQKREHIIYSSKVYLERHPSKKPPRYDIIEVFLSDEGEARINHIIDAFS